MTKVVAALALLFAGASAQLGSQVVTEVHPKLNVQTCGATGCTTVSKSITVDSNWRWLESDGQNCFTGNTWDQTNCPSTEEGATSCAANCALEGATYEESYGIKTEDDQLSLAFVTTTNNAKKARKGFGTEETLTNVGSRNYLMNDDGKYEMFNLKNREFTFDVDVSQLVCGLNGALYFVEMDEDGGKAKYDGNTAGAEFGTGYCDAQCPHDLKFINGEANVLDWLPSETDPNSGTGHYGTCCIELDIWEANAISQAYTPHTCSPADGEEPGQTRCEGAQCGDIDDSNPESRYEGLCDKDGCDLNPYRYGIKDFYGMGGDFAVDTTKPMTVVTQFITEDGTDAGDLKEIRRLYVQNGAVINSPTIPITNATTGETKEFDSISDEFCAASRAAFDEPHNDYKEHGGMKAMGESMDRGHVLVMSLWDDHYARMLWLDSTYPVNGTTPGVERGSCPTTSGAPEDVETNSPNATVTFANIKWGTIGSTYGK